MSIDLTRGVGSIRAWRIRDIGVLLREGKLPLWWGVILVSLAWGIGWRVGRYYGYDTFASIDSDVIFMAFCGAFASLIAALITLWQIRSGKLKAGES